VPDQGSQAVRQRRLAAELRRLREQAGLTGDEAAERLGWSGSKISRIELHRIGVKAADLAKLLELYQVDTAYGQELQALVTESSRAGRGPAAAGMPADFAEYLSAEREAGSIWHWNPLAVPGLLQTEAYTRAVHLGYQSMFRLPPGDVERRIQLRRNRQQVLSRTPPLGLLVVIDESVLHRRFGANAVMRAQLQWLTEVSSAVNVLADIEVRVLPLGGEHLVAGGFSHMQFPQVHDVPLHDLVYLEHLTGSYYLEDEEQTYRYRVTFEALLEKSLEPAQSAELISKTAREMWA
jgi:transcriptional regulator with XRE-family HTH domain